MPANLIVNNIRKSYLTGHIRMQVLSDISLIVEPGNLTLISGPSGCGKSTLLSIISGLLRPDEGSVSVFGQDLWKLSARERERFRLKHTGFVFQGYNLFPALTALEQVALPLTYLGFTIWESIKRAKAAIDEIGLGTRSGLRPSELSGGEKQRIAIARALAKNPGLLFADEPTSALDAHNGMVVIDTMHRIAKEHSTIVLCVSHDPRLIEHADRVITMEDGQLLNDLRDLTHSA
ncbi:MAG TPA: ABC transporter ATP-binding protein [Gammaproteobacteria bacterium]|nr:ABC transporter ATP-binding protein [Gammaproteobacteria bacterium]